MKAPKSSTRLLADYKRALRLGLAKTEQTSTDYDAYSALALVCREHLVDRWLATEQRRRKDNPKHVYYLSMEFLMGRHLQNAVLNLDLESGLRASMQKLGKVLEDLYEQEHEPGLGNGGLGRLAACFLDSMATLDIPAIGYGIRYEFGIFRQEIRDGFQVEFPDNWLHRGNPWEVARPEDIVTIRFGGYSEDYVDEIGCWRKRWAGGDTILALPYDTPVPGYGTKTVNTLRLWEARASEQFDLEYFNRGDYLGAVARKTESETISKVLYPADNSARGQELRLKQEYFFVSASLQDILRRFFKANDDLHGLPDKAAVQMNDTHPALAVPELMRLLVDEHRLGWEEAWDITRATLAYTNHTLLPEALEQWDVGLIQRLLPRHMEIIYEINRRFLDDVRLKAPDDQDLVRRVSLIDEEGGKRVRMAHLAVVGSRKVNGVAALHSQLLRKQLMPDFDRLFPGKFCNVTNGVTPRRWLRQSNPALALLLSRHIKGDWCRDLDLLAQITPLAEDAGFRDDFRAAKAANKAVFADYLEHIQAEKINPDWIFDVQIKRIHEYKRQLLNLLRVIADYFRILEGTMPGLPPRVVFLGGKAAPAYFIAKLIIRLAHGIADAIAREPKVRQRLQLVFLRNYNVSLAERVIPAADLSEQISTAGYEASGTSNMKFAMNGALTIGTLDGANIEIAEAVGEDNLFIFGLTAGEVKARREAGYDPRHYIAADPLLAAALESLKGERFCPGQAGLFMPLYDLLARYGDHYMLCADFASYMAAQDRAASCYADPTSWTAKAIRTVAAMGRFSSDRSIRDYARLVWGLGVGLAP